MSCDSCDCDLSGNCTSRPDVDLSGSIPTQSENPAQQEVEATWGLRLRERISQLGNDLSNNLVVLHPVIRPPSFEQIARYNPPRLNEIYLQSMLSLIQFLRSSAIFFQFVWQVLVNATKGARRTFRDEVYVFFRDSSYPYLLDSIELNKPGMPDVEWYYNAKTHTFLTARLFETSVHHHTSHVPYLSAEIKYNDLTLYDVSEFMNGVRWAGEENAQMPNVDHLVSAWSLSSGVVLQRSPQMRLFVVNTDGNEVGLPLRNET